MYMVERGAMECWYEEGVPMSLQGVWAACLEGCGGVERYQVRFVMASYPEVVLMEGGRFIPTSSARGTQS